MEARNYVNNVLPVQNSERILIFKDFLDLVSFGSVRRTSVLPQKIMSETVFYFAFSKNIGSPVENSPSAG